jgi:phosphinothricin acetyltransferase
MSVIIRAAVASDMDAIAHIYEHHVRHGTATFEIEPPDSNAIGRRWSEVTARGLP